MEVYMKCKATLISVVPLVCFLATTYYLTAQYAPRLEQKPNNWGPGTIDAMEVRKNMGRLAGTSAKVCGRVVTATPAGQPARIALGDPNPPAFWIVTDLRYWSQNNFGKVACVTGTVRWSNGNGGVPQIEVTSSNQLEIRNVAPHF
jgi:hypothetical protein